MPQEQHKNKALIDRRHPEWRQNNIRFRWLLDSLEGGQRYREATYGQDTRGQPVRNLVRHKREFPEPRDESNVGIYPSVPPSWLGITSDGLHGTSGADPYSATDNDYDLRRARTPVPTMVREAVENDLDQIYAREVKRDGPESLVAWWKDVDGEGTTIDDWMAQVCAPLMLVSGGLDIAFDHPPAPAGARIETRADQDRLGLADCVVSFILPENMVWWRKDRRGYYTECLVREVAIDDDDKSVVRFRRWTDSGWTLYDDKGDRIDGDTHPFGVVPIVRVFDGRRKSRSENTPQSRYEGVAERMREYYNRDSELVLSDTQQAHPLLQGPEDYVQADGTVPIGPSWMLPKKKDISGGSAHYEGFEYVTPPKDPADSIRLNKAWIQSEVDRDTKQTRVAGDVAVAKGTIEQSGISKSLDHKPAHNRLAKIAKTLQHAERKIAEFALRILSDAGPTPVAMDDIEVVYSPHFELWTASDIATASASFQMIAARTGLGLPTIEESLLAWLVRQVRPGLTDEEYAAFDAEINAFIASGGGIASAMAQQAATATGGAVKGSMNDPTSTLQPPGQTGKKGPLDDSEDS